MYASKFILFSAVILSCCVLQSGCGGRGNAADDLVRRANKTNMNRLITMYAQYQRTNKGVGPKDEAKFKAFINESNTATLERMGVDPGAVDDIFISERDSEPFDIRFGVYGATRGSFQAIIFEKTGLKGVRQVGFSNREIWDVEDDQEYQDLLEGKPVRDANPESQNPNRRG